MDCPSFICNWKLFFILLGIILLLIFIKKIIKGLKNLFSWIKRKINGAKRKRKTIEEKPENSYQGKTLKEVWKSSSLFSKISLIVFILLIALSLVLIIYYQGNFVLDILKRNFGNFFVKNLLYFFIYSFGISFLLSFLVLILYSIFSKSKKPRLAFGITIFLVIFIFIFGMYFIDSSVGNSPLNLNLWEGQNYSGTIKCENNITGIMKEWSEVICEIDIPFEFSSTSHYVTFFYTNDSSFTEDFDSYTFIAPPDIRHIIFSLKGYDEEGIWRSLSTGWYYHFPNKEELEENQKDFSTYLLGLLAIIFISVPTAVINLRKLWRDN